MFEQWKAGRLARFRIAELSPSMLAHWKTIREHNLTYDKKISQKYRYYKTRGYSSAGAYTLATKSLKMAGLTPINEKEWFKNV